MTSIERCYNIADLRTEAKRRLPKWIFEFVDRGTEDEVGMRYNIEALQRIKLRQRALVDVSGRDLGATIFGKRVTMPLAIAPTGAAGLCWYEGELALAKAAAKFGVPFTMAISSTTSLDKVADEAGGQLWVQMYVWEDRQLTYDLVKRAERAGYEALVVTVDVNLGVNREFNLRNGYGNPFKPSYRTVRDILLRPGWMTSVLFRYFATTGMPKQANMPPVARNVHGSVLRGKDSRITWEDLARLRERWPGKLVVKGVMRADDAARALAIGADGIVVSNHGARNVDMAVASIDALPAIVSEVGGKATIMLDSGIRRGSDMIKAYALGADAVLIGRAALWGAAAGGQAGAERGLNLLKREYELTLAHLGCRNRDELSPDVLANDLPYMGMQPTARRRSVEPSSVVEFKA
jgi:isopentenyl diphosphate isomerase/L-lactate dehydrogenase-like FMN-dependent dehydrogenase